MSDLIQKILVGLLRLALVPVVNWLINHGIITDDESVKLVAEVASWLAIGGWLVWSYIKAHRKTLTALTMPKGATLAELDAKMRAGSLPSITTGRTETPKIQE
jgi:hypothetical protein